MVKYFTDNGVNKKKITKTSLKSCESTFLLLFSQFKLIIKYTFSKRTIENNIF